MNESPVLDDDMMSAPTQPIPTWITQIACELITFARGGKSPGMNYDDVCLVESVCRDLMVLAAGIPKE